MLQVPFLILLTSSNAQQFKASPVQNSPQQQFIPSQAYNPGLNHTQPLLHAATPPQQIHHFQNDIFTSPPTNLQQSPVQHAANPQSDHFEHSTVSAIPSQFLIPEIPPSQRIFEFTSSIGPNQIVQNPKTQNQTQFQASQSINQMRLTPVQHVTPSMNSVVTNQQHSTTVPHQQEVTSRLETASPPQAIPQASQPIPQMRVEPAHAVQPPLQKAEIHQDERVTESPEQLLFERQAKNAKYSFNSSIMDNIMDNTQTREEVRNGLLVTGVYSYSDGFFHRTVHYEADQNGYRVIK